MENGVFAVIATAFAEMCPVAVFIAVCERAVGMLVRAVSGSRGNLL